MLAHEVMAHDNNSNCTYSSEMNDPEDFASHVEYLPRK
jgi:hypothetical protein